jgi:hypothetical protein
MEVKNVGADLEGEAVAAQAPEITVTGGSVSRMQAAVRVACRRMLMREDRDAGPCGLAQIEGRPVAAINFDRGPFRQHRQRRRVKAGKFRSAIDPLAADNGQDRLDPLDYRVSRLPPG